MKKIDFESTGMKYSVKESHFNFEENLTASPGVKFYEYQKKNQSSLKKEITLISSGQRLEEKTPLELQTNLSLSNYKILT